MRHNGCIEGTSRWALAVLVCASVAACDVFNVTNPGPIVDEALNEQSAGPTVLVGIIADVENATDEISWLSAPASTDLEADATQPWIQNAGEGSLTVVDAEYTWNPGQLSIWASEAGIQRLNETQPNASSSPLIASGYMWAGWANRVMGDNMCIAVFDGGPAQDSKEYHRRALDRFSEARSRAQSIGLDSIALAATAGLAQSNLILGNYSEAASLAAQVPDDFIWVAHRSNNSGREENNIRNFTFDNQKQMTVWNTYADSVGGDTDPRTPWADLNQTAGGGTKPFYRQLKYSDKGSDIPLAKGREMRLIEAEVQLRGGDRDGAMAMINYVRGLVGLDPVTVATDADAWLALDHERHAELWMEGRRLIDNRRFSQEGLSAWAVAFMQGRDDCFPPSQAEISANPNISSWP